MATGVSGSTAGDEMEDQRLKIESYRDSAVQCLVLGEYSKSGPYVLEVMVHYVYVEMLFHADSSKDIWYLLALEVNLAKRMGYHRDPSHFAGISLLEAEMRRRLWVTVLLGDVLLSTRPETEHTTVLGVIARRRMLVALGAISDLAAATKPCNYAEVMRVDGVLHEALASIPPPLRMRPIASSITDPPQLIMSRLFLGHMFYKGQIMLHRRFLRRGGDETVYSSKTCLDACLGTLKIQHILDEETRPGGQLQMMRWRMTSIMNHQFLTATTILCMLLHRGQTLHRDEEIKESLQKTRSIWLQGSATSLEAQKGSEIVNMVLAKFGVGPPAQKVPSLESHEELSAVPVVQNDTFANSSNNSGVMHSYPVSGMALQGTPGSGERGTFVGLDRLENQYLNPNTGFLIDPTEDDGTLDGWMIMNDIGMN
ncbi:hypothetical protein KVR01_000534 [Diaporthe batatas]|uniref:uncharacterized protein n=1 Tax=Diaporthe batatas TaxID=748121 RepID=UPI001D0459AE|nr:uncharacterized protein KVR01_000534 [Diaporthe batatas]KAG8169789.1 hypothetical protein KVR01_000534 [Diaporthe batatas]